MQAQPELPPEEIRTPEQELAQMEQAILYLAQHWEEKMAPKLKQQGHDKRARDMTICAHTLRNLLVNLATLPASANSADIHASVHAASLHALLAAARKPSADE